jgi:hypothetical protein
MSCKIEKAKNGKINKVLDAVGNPSQLFKQIFNVPALSLEDALNVYKNIYSKEFAPKQKVQEDKKLTVVETYQEDVQSENDFQNKLQEKLLQSLDKIQLPQIKIDFIAPKTLVNTKNPVESKNKQAAIKDKYKKLMELINCK